MSLSTGIFPAALKHAIISPIIKKPSLDPNNLKNYCPVSNIKFLSKVIENTISNHMRECNLGEPLQSAYSTAHSTEMALLLRWKTTSWPLFTIAKVSFLCCQSCGTSYLFQSAPPTLCLCSKRAEKLFVFWYLMHFTCILVSILFLLYILSCFECCDQKKKK